MTRAGSLAPRLLRRTLLSTTAAALVVAGVVVATPSSTRPTAAAPSPAEALWARLIASSTDLGPARERTVSVALELRSAVRPLRTEAWARAHALHVTWRPGQTWAVLGGTAADVGRAFGLPVHDYRTQTGRRFFGAAGHPAVPAGLGVEVTGVGRIGAVPFTPRSALQASGGLLPALVPPGGLTPAGTLRAYDAKPLADAGMHGEGQTVVMPEVTSFEQSDMDKFTADAGLPPIQVEQVGDFAAGSEDAGEVTMDVQVVHAIAPAAKLVIVDFSQVGNSGADYAEFFNAIDQRYPGAVWSVSFIIGCDKLFSPTDLEVAEQAMAAVTQHGTTSYVSSGDTDGLECKDFLQQNFNSPPSQDDVGVNAIGSLPSMTSAGGTALSVTTDGDWLSEAVWTDPMLTIGTGGGASTVVPRPDYQQGVGTALPAETADYRLVPDLSAVADSRTGLRIVSGGEFSQGGGTSQAAPVLAGLTALMNQYLEKNGGHKIGAINPLLYALGTGRPAYPPFHDVTLGGNALWDAAPGYDPATGWGTPDTWNLARDILDLQKKAG